jgi:radical SAM superfamily enzyme YgiQ (UPF0313 family)
VNALLIYPEFPDTFWSFKHALSLLGKKSAFPPLGLMTIASMLPATWTRRLVDTNVETLHDSDIEWADIILASAVQIQRHSLRGLIKRCKAHNKTVVIGGPYTSTCPDDSHGADHVFIGEAEETFPMFLRDLANGEAKPVYRNPTLPALSSTPVPDFSLVDVNLYSDMSVQFSRGCPFQCEFCDIIEIYGRVPRTKSNQQVIAELESLRENGWSKDVFIVDDNFIGNKREVKRLLRALIEWSEERGHPFCFITEASVNLADDVELLDLMRRANFRRVFVGIETPIDASLKEARKGQNTRRNLHEAVHKIQSYGLEVMAGFIVGFDNDPENIFDLQIEFIRESAIPLAMVSLLAAIPMTQLHRRLEREGRLLNIRWEGDNTECELNFVPHMDSQRLIDGYKTILRSIYDPPAYYHRALASLERVMRDHSPKSPHVLSFNDVLSLGRLTFKLGVWDKARFDFWRYMRKVITTHREKFEDGVVLAAIGYHLRKLTETYCG